MAMAMVFAVACPSPAWSAGSGHISVPDATVKAAPFDVAAEIARLREGDKVVVFEQPLPGWRRIQMQDGRFGVVRDAELALDEAYVPPAEAKPHAELSAPTPPLVPPARSVAITSMPKLSVGAMFEVLPFGTLETSSLVAGEVTTSDNDAATAWALGLFFDCQLVPHLDVGVAPRMAFHLRDAASSVGAPAKELDLRARVTVHGEIGPGLSFFTRLSPGYSRIFLPSSSSTSSSKFSDPSGLVLEFSTGLTREIGPTTDLVFELGYQLGFQSGELTTEKEKHDLKTSLSSLHLGIGLAHRL